MLTNTIELRDGPSADFSVKSLFSLQKDPNANKPKAADALSRLTEDSFALPFNLESGANLINKIGHGHDSLANEVLYNCNHTNNFF